MTLLTVFIARCEAISHLYAVAEMDLHDAVDRLQACAPIEAIGQDAAQSIMAEAFKRASAKRRATLAA
jgi:hypothetical protein